MAEKRVLAVDVGGTHVKLLLSGETEPRRFASDSKLTPQQMMEGIAELTKDWRYDAVSVGIPSPVHSGRVIADPVNLGTGWVGFDYEGEFGKPTKVMNDAAMQALGSYEGGGKMLFLGLGTGLGSALVIDNIVEPMELGHLPFRKKTFEDYVGDVARKRLGKKKWQKAVADTIEQLRGAIEPDYIVLGGGNAKRVDPLPPGVRLGSNDNAFAGAFRLWPS